MVSNLLSLSVNSFDFPSSVLVGVSARDLGKCVLCGFISDSKWICSQGMNQFQFAICLYTNRVFSLSNTLSGCLVTDLTPHV